MRRVGRFTVSLRFHRDAMDSAGDGANLFHGMFIIEAAPMLHADLIEYVGVHPDFDLLERGERAPWYQATFPDGEIYPKWVRE